MWIEISRTNGTIFYCYNVFYTRRKHIRDRNQFYVIGERLYT